MEKKKSPKNHGPLSSDAQQSKAKPNPPKEKPQEPTDFRKMTPLLNAALDGNAELCAALIKAGADISARDNFGRTALHWAAGSGEIECVKLLLDAGADVEAVDSFGRTASDHGAEMRLASPEIEWLLKNG